MLRIGSINVDKNLYRSWLYIIDVLENLQFDILGIAEAGIDVDEEVPQVPGFVTSYSDKNRLVVYPLQDVLYTSLSNSISKH